MSMCCLPGLWARGLKAFAAPDQNRPLRVRAARSIVLAFYPPIGTLAVATRCAKAWL